VSKKQKAFAFELFSFAMIFTSAFGVWALTQTVRLIEPQPVIASYRPAAEASARKKEAADSQAALAKFKASLQKTVDEFAAHQNAGYGIFVRHLPSGVTAEHRAGEVMESASLYKLFAAQLAYQKVDSGQWRLNDLFDTSRNWTLKKCLEAMITVSDNECGRAILKRIGYQGINAAAMARLGYPDTDLSGVYTKSSARDVAALLEKLYSNEILTKSSGHAFLDLLAAQKINNRLPQGLPDGVQIMHKTGDLDGFVHDAGIVRSFNGDYIIVVMSEPDPSAQRYADRYAPFAEISKEVYETITGKYQR